MEVSDAGCLLWLVLAHTGKGGVWESLQPFSHGTVMTSPCHVGALPISSHFLLFTQGYVTRKELERKAPATEVILTWCRHKAVKIPVVGS